MTLFAIYYKDARERRHVIAVQAHTPEDALEQCIAYQNDYNGFYCDVPPDRDDVVEIDVRPIEGVQVLWHQDYD